MIFCLRLFDKSPWTILIKSVSFTTDYLYMSFRALTFEPSEIFLKHYYTSIDVKMLLTSKVICAGSAYIHDFLSSLVKF